MLLFDRNGFNAEHSVFASRYFALKACSVYPSLFHIRREIVEGQVCYSVWIRYIFPASCFEEEDS